MRSIPSSPPHHSYPPPSLLSRGKSDFTRQPEAFNTRFPAWPHSGPAPRRSKPHHRQQCHTSSTGDAGEEVRFLLIKWERPNLFCSRTTTSARAYILHRFQTRNQSQRRLLATPIRHRRGFHSPLPNPPPWKIARQESRRMKLVKAGKCDGRTGS